MACLTHHALVVDDVQAEYDRLKAVRTYLLH